MSSITETLRTPIHQMPANTDAAQAALAAFEARSQTTQAMGPDALLALQILASGPYGDDYARAYFAVANYAREGNLQIDFDPNVVDEAGLQLALTGLSAQENPNLEEVSTRVANLRAFYDGVLHFLVEPDQRHQSALRPELQNQTPNELIANYVERTFALAHEHGGLNEDAINALRQEFFTPERDRAFMQDYQRDTYVVSDGYGNLVNQPDTAGFGAVNERRDPGPVTTREPYVATVPGTDTPRSPEALVAALREAGGNEREIVSLVTGLRGDELTQVAYGYLNQTAPSSLPAVGSESREALINQFREALPVDRQQGDIIESIVANEGFMPPYMRLYLNASNRLPNWLPLGSENGPAVHRLLESMSDAERTQAFAMVEQELGLNREELLTHIDNDQHQRYARFLSVVPKQPDGTIDDGWMLGYRLAELRGDFGLIDRVTDVHRSNMDLAEFVRLSNGATEADMARAALAYQWLSQIDDPDEFALPEGAPAVLELPEGTDPATFIEQSGLAAAIREEMVQTLGGLDRIGGENRDAVQAWATSLMHGMRFDPTDATPGANDGETLQGLREHNDYVSGRNAEIVAGAMNLARLGIIDSNPMLGTLSVVDRDYAEGEVPPLNGRPTRTQVFEAFERVAPADAFRGQAGSESWREQAARSVEHVVNDNGLDGVVRATLTSGYGYFSPDSTAALAYAAIHGGTSEIRGGDRERFYEVMDLSWLTSVDQRNEYLAQVYDAYRTVSGGSGLLEDVATTFGRELTFEGPNGEHTVESRAMVLAQRGVLTSAEKIIHARYEHTSLFNLMPRREFDTIVEGLNEISGASSFITPAVLANMVGMEYNPSAPAAVYDAILDGIDDPSVQFAALQALPSADDIARAEMELRAFVLRPDSARQAAMIDEQVHATTGLHPNDYLHRVFPDLDSSERGAQRQVQEIMDGLLAGHPTIGDMVRAQAVSPEVLTSRIEDVTRSASSGAVMQFINRSLGNEHEVVMRDLEELAAIS
ncbi:MAG: hypothetical protein AAFY60_01465, partial [Myxococcota bacterium]